MSNLVIAVKSCRRDREAGFHDAIRGTWGKEFRDRGIDVRFFIGAAKDSRAAITLLKDEVIVDAPDDYMGLPFKTRQICKWTQGKIIKHLFLCDCDTFIKVPELLKMDYEASDFSGHFCRGPEETTMRFDYQDHMGVYKQMYPWCSGGVGYFLSQRACMEVADVYPKYWAEDMYVGQAIGPLVVEQGFNVEHLYLNEKATWHFRKSPKFPEFTPELLSRAYNEGGFDGIYEEAKRR